MVNSQISDVRVILSAAKPLVVAGLGNPAVFVKTKSTDASFKPRLVKAYDDSTAGDAFGADSDAYKVAKIILGQENRPEHIDFFEYSDLSAAFDQFYYEDWHFAMLATYSKEDVALLAGAMADRSFKFVVVQVESADELLTLTKADRVIGLVHPYALGRLDAMLLGNVANRTVGSVTWKFRSGSGVQANPLTPTQLAEIDTANGIAYVERGGVATTTEGKVLTGEFIESLHGEDWVKTDIAARVQQLFNNTDRVPDNAQGNAMIEAQVKISLETAYQQGIIQSNDDTGKGDYKTFSTPRANRSAEDNSKHRYRGGFTYNRAKSIHSATVNGTIYDN